MFRNKNLKDELERERSYLAEAEAAELVIDAFEILNDQVYLERDLRNRIEQSEKYPSKMYFGLEQERIFSIDEIRNLCVKYRLRFLDSSHFNGELPYEVISRLKELESRTKQKFDSFRICAPAEVFELGDCEKDPMFFINLGLDKFYLVHQWGEDMHWSRKWLMFPFRSIYTLGLSILAVSVFLSLLVPTAFVENAIMDDPFWARLAFFGWAFSGILAATSYVGFRLFRSLSVHEWNSPFQKKK